jgi:CheY-like chemotaxis protein
MAPGEVAEKRVPLDFRLAASRLPCHHPHGKGGVGGMAAILLVEAEDQVRVLAASFLEDQGHTVLTTATADGAFAILRSDQPVDLLLTEITLKEDVEGGIELAAQSVTIRPEIKVLYTTERTLTDGMRVRFVKGSAVLEKPFTTEQLVHALVAHFGIKPENNSSPAS